jgi:hypothetical protein
MADYEDTSSAPESSWWDEEDPAQCLAGTVLHIVDNDKARLDQADKLHRLYGGSRLYGLRPWEGPEGAQQLAAKESTNQDKLRFNVVKAATDTVTSKVGKLRPRPTFLTDGGDWSLQLKAKQLQRFMDGAYHQADVYELGPDVFRDAMVFGTGIFHPHRRGKRLQAERTRPWEVFVDPDDAMYGSPRCLYRLKWLAQQQVVATYGKRAAAAAVADARTKPREDLYGYAGYVRCIEAWCLPTADEPEERERGTGKFKPKAGEYGRHVVLVGDEVVLDEDYPWREFPFVFVHWTKPIQGFWGLPAIQEVVGVQVEINKLLQLTQQSMARVGQPIFLKRSGVILSPKELTGEVGLEIEVDSDVATLQEAVQVVTFQPIHPQIIQHIWQLWGKAFEILGSNQLAASATAPVGMESGRALETLAEEHSERFMTVSRHFEHALGELMARQFLRLAKQIDAEQRAAGNGGFVIRSPGSKASLRIKWRDVQMDEDAFLIQVFPTSVLPTTPAARIKEVERLAAAGWIDPTEARRLLDFPDLRQGTDLAVADTENLLHQLEQMLEHGKPTAPEPYQDLDKAGRWATAAILRSQADGVPSPNIDLVRDFVTAVDALKARATAAAQAQQAVGPQPAAAQQSAQPEQGALPASEQPLA